MMPVLDELLVRIGMDTTGVEEGTEQVNQQMDGLAAPAAAAGIAAGGLFIAGLTNAMDASSANTKLQNQLNLNDEEAARAGTIAGDVFSAGFSDSIGGVNEALGAVASNLGGMGKVGDKELASLTKAAIGLADTFEFDVGESTQAMGTLIKTGLAKDGTEAMDLLTATAQKLPKAFREELPSLTREYGEFFQQLGFTGPEMMGLLTEAAKNPTFELDKMGDALKEFTLLMADTGKVKEPLKELGLDVKEIQKLMNEGKGTEAFDKVTGALKDVEDQTKRTSLQAALFGGPGEDMGNSLLNLNASGAAAANGLDKAAGSSKELTDNIAASASLNSIWRQITTTLGEFLAPALQKVSTFMNEHPGLIKILVPIVLGLAVAFGIFAIAVWAVNIAMLANPVAWIILGIIALIAVVALIIIKWDEIKESTAQTWGYIVDKLGEAWGWITRKASELWAWLGGVFSDGWNWIVRNVWNPVRDFFTKKIPGWVGDGVQWVKDKWNDAVGWFAGIPGRLASGARGMWNFVTDGLKSALNGAIGLVNDGIFFINDKLIANANRLPGVNIPWIPYIPYLAEGGVTTGPTLAMIGEGAEQEAVLPLSKLEHMISMGGHGDMRAPSVSKVQPIEVRVTASVDGSAFADAFKYEVRTRAGGSVARYAGEDD
ncbi:hypothetical protein [Streptomyces sp. NPDC018833]|uniref:hypothetical protein n=1 Tax=Streptomyces sp. NPDC018833 TaxID=3365053 RepID=UPI0037B4CE3A